VLSRGRSPQAMCFERLQGSVVAPGTYESSSIGDEIDTKLAGISRRRESKWSGGEGWN
jgi:hypothetical protein